MNKNENIMSLYNKLPNRGDKGKFLREASKLCNVKALSIKNHWILMQDVPEKFQDEIISLLQNMNKVAA